GASVRALTPQHLRTRSLSPTGDRPVRDVCRIAKGEPLAGCDRRHGSAEGWAAYKSPSSGCKRAAKRDRRHEAAGCEEDHPRGLDIAEDDGTGGTARARSGERELERPPGVHRGRAALTGLVRI